MAGTVKFVPPRVPLVDLRSGQITREWYLLFASLFEGSDGPGGLPDPTDDMPLISYVSNLDQLPGTIPQEIVPLPDQSVTPLVDAMTLQLADPLPPSDFSRRLDDIERTIAVLAGGHGDPAQFDAFARTIATLAPQPDLHGRLDAIELVIAGLGPTQSGISSKAGSYTPTLTNVVNVTATTAHLCDYTQVGDRVIVSGNVEVQATASGVTAIRMSLPVASNFTANDQANGAGGLNIIASGSAVILSDAATDTAQFNFVSPGAGTYGCSFIYQYRIM